MLSTSDLIYEVCADILGPILILILAPLFTGILAKFRAVLEARQGPSIIQPYLDLKKLLAKETICPEASSWIFRAFPFLSLALMIVIVFAVPVFSTTTIFAEIADSIFIFALFLLIAFFAVLAAMDTGTSFAGLGASREAFMMMLLEPTIMVIIMSLAIEFNTTNLFQIISENVADKSILTHPNMIFMAVAFLIVIIVEAKRFPVDNPNTHLELTMIHEAMILEYSGKYLALIEYSSMIKLTLLVSLFFSIFYPFGVDADHGYIGLGISFVLWAVKVLGFAFALALFEKSTAKLRVFRIPELISFSLTLAMISIFAHYFIKV